MDRKSAVVLGVIFGGLFLALFAFLMLAYAAVRSGGSEEGASSFSSGPAIGVIELKGVITSVDKQLKALRRFEKDEAIKAILVRIDSPGGSVGPSQELYSELRKMGEKRKVVCSMGSLAASGGMYVAAGCQKIVASPGTLTGSIGVISQFPNLSRIAQRFEFKVETIKSGSLKDAGNPLRDMTPAERVYWQALIDRVYGQFLKAVVEARGLSEAKVRAVADGRVITGEEAMEAGLVDAIGNFRVAMDLAVERAKLKGEPDLVYPHDDRGRFLEQILGSAARAAVRSARDELTASASDRSGPALYFLAR